MNDQPVERTRHISITRTGADGMVSQTEVHITAVHHRSVDTGSASASVQADVEEPGEALVAGVRFALYADAFLSGG